MNRSRLNGIGAIDFFQRNEELPEIGTVVHLFGPQRFPKLFA